MLIIIKQLLFELKKFCQYSTCGDISRGAFVGTNPLKCAVTFQGNTVYAIDANWRHACMSREWQLTRIYMKKRLLDLVYGYNSMGGGGLQYKKISW